MIASKRYVCYDQADGGYYCESTAWDNWVRWVVLAVVIIGFFLLFILCSCLTARRRRAAGRMPYYGTGWAAGNNYGQRYNDPGYGNPAPPYSPAPQYGYYGQQQTGVELQGQPSAPVPAYTRGADNVYEPPVGPPPNKKGDVIR